MSIFRIVKNKDNPYVIINKSFLEDNRLSYKAKGILAYLLSKPDDWKVYIKDIINSGKDGKDSVRSGIMELEKYGYIVKSQIRTVDGKFNGYDYDVYEIPIFEHPCNDNDLTGAENPETEKPFTENPPVLNNKYTNNKIEEEESGEKQKLSTELTHRYQTIFNRKLSANFEKEILNLYTDETIIDYCLTLAELQADKPAWLIATLKDWKENNLNTVEEIEEYLNNRKNTGKKGKPVKGDSVPKIDENIVNMELNEEDINIINDLHNKYKDSPLSPYYSKKNTELIFKIYKAKSPVKNLDYIKQKMISIAHIKTTPEKIANNFDFYIKILEGYR